MIKRSAVWLLIATVALVTLTGCPPGVEADSGDTGDPLSASGTRTGYNLGQITVTVTMTDLTYTTIEKVEVTVKGKAETPGRGSVAISGLPPKMVAQNRVDIADTISGATVTSNAIKGAAQDAYDILMARKSP
jgi:Na+-translocating ferredoxin:NAD+ oxidoreductase RnfG subunit